MPTTVTDQDVREATLPLKIEEARRAIASCTDLPELLKYQDQAKGLAAAVKVMKTVAPEMVSSANRMCKEAVVRIGELLLQYNGRPVHSEGGKTHKGARTRVAEELGIPRSTQVFAVRIATAPKDVIQTILQDDKISPSPPIMAARTPRLVQNTGKVIRSDQYNVVMHGSTNGIGLGRILNSLSAIGLHGFSQLAPDESRRIKKKIREISDLLDEMDRLCP